MKPVLIQSSFQAALLCLLIAGCTGARPADLGVRAGRLAPCPRSPNCVSSQSRDPDHAVQPLPFTGTEAQTRDELIRVLLGMKRVLITNDEGDYVRAEFTSPLFRFVDDVEFWLDESASLVQVRSASRLGYSDMGVNRERIETIRSLWDEQGKK